MLIFEPPKWVVFLLISKIRQFCNFFVTTSFLWNLLSENDVTKAEMLEGLLNNFNISTVLALGDIDIFIRTMKENGIIE